MFEFLKSKLPIRDDPRAFLASRATPMRSAEICGSYGFIILFALVILTGLDAETAPVPGSQPKPTEKVFGQVRQAKHDIVLLGDGTKWTGEILTGTLDFRMAYGRLGLEKKFLAGLDLAAGTNSPHCVVLANGDRLSGLLETQVIQFQPDTGPQTNLWSKTIAQVVFGIQDGELQGFDSFQRSALENGSALETNLEGLVWISAGEFVMGSPSEESGREQDEGPQTRVMIPKGYWIGKCEVTQGEYQRVMASNPSNSTGDLARPVEKVSWFDAVDYCAKLTQQAEAAGRLPKGYVFRLPTEAEWEYACRAGTKTRFSYGEDLNGAALAEYGWFTQNSDSTPHPVGTKRPNLWGLYDMHGNVWEWCLDRWDGTFPGGTITNLATAGTGSLRVARGGSWLYEAKACRSANRDDYSPFNRCSDLGFRVVLAPAQ